ncbi:hypothetical protein AYI69_g8937 [Smittium culicis]|uniref:Uncharacterized protein n=1 Tax=Smittium culicis TaxID=133412 RepID=A0A1R1XG52_9FUNG|nr:hypothetical protein AYI69_g8937 [Smittium culicis]
MRKDKEDCIWAHNKLNDELNIYGSRIIGSYINDIIKENKILKDYLFAFSTARDVLIDDSWIDNNREDYEKYREIDLQINDLIRLYDNFDSKFKEYNAIDDKDRKNPIISVYTGLGAKKMLNSADLTKLAIDVVNKSNYIENLLMVNMFN